jgi:PAS domain S-box-containing protein
MTQRVALSGGWTGFPGACSDGAAASAAAADLINILDTVDVPIVVVRRDFVTACFNKAAADTLGLSPSDIGRATRDVSVLAGLSRLDEQCSQVIAGGPECRADLRHGDKWFVVRISPYAKGDRELAGAVLTFTNVTAFRASINQAIYERECTKAILNTVTDPLVVLSADQRIQSGNRAFYTMFQVARDETQGVPLYGLGNGAFELSSLRKRLEEMLAGSHAFEPVEVEYVIPGKGQRTLVLNAHPLSFPGHSERRVLVTFQDITAHKQAEAAKDLRVITERKRSEEELQRSEAQLAEARRELQLTIDTIPAMVATFRSDGARDFVNRTFRDYFGLTSQETGQAYVIRLHPDDVEGADNAWRTSLANGQPFQMEMRILGNDGKHRWHTVRRIPLRNENGDIVKWYGVMVDIEEQKAAENALRRSEAFLAEAQRLSLTGSFSWQVSTGEITWSEQLYRIFEFDQGMPVTLELISTRVHPEDLPLFNGMIDRGRGARGDFDYEYRLQMSDHSVKYVRVIAHGTRDKDGGLEYIGAAQDVTQRRMSEEALAKARSDLAHAARVTSLGVLTASIAHEVNQPLAAIVTNGESSLRWLARDQPDIERVRTLANRVVADARRASEIIERIRGMASERVPEKRLLSIDDVIGESLSLLRHELQLRGIGVSVDLAPELPQVVGDATQLQQVIVNLTINAVQAMTQLAPADRSISIRVMLSDPDRVCCSIEDSGPGIDPQHLPRLFDSFFTTKDTGMGMGLAICRSIVEAHGGRIRADNNSALGGARFSFDLLTRRAE